MKKFFGFGILIAGLALIFFYVKSRAPHRSRVEFIFPQEGVDAWRIAIDYLPMGGTDSESLRRVERFPKGRISLIADEPTLPEGRYLVRLTLWVAGGRLSFQRRYDHGTADLTRFNVSP